MNWWGILYAVVLFSLVFHFTLRVLQPDPSAPIITGTTNIHAVPVMDPPPSRFEFHPQ